MRCTNGYDLSELAAKVVCLDKIGICLACSRTGDQTTQAMGDDVDTGDRYVCCAVFLQNLAPSLLESVNRYTGLIWVEGRCRICAPVVDQTRITAIRLIFIGFQEAFETLPARGSTPDAVDHERWGID